MHLNHGGAGGSASASPKEQQRCFEHSRLSGRRFKARGIRVRKRRTCRVHRVGVVLSVALTTSLAFAARAEMQFVSRRIGAGLSCLFLLAVSLFLAPTADAQPYTVLHAFAGSDGRYPLAGLVEGSDGNFYGTTTHGGASDNGTVFKITPAGTLTTLHSFAGSDGQYSTPASRRGAMGTSTGRRFGAELLARARSSRSRRAAR